MLIFVSLLLWTCVTEHGNKSFGPLQNHFNSEVCNDADRPLHGLPGKIFLFIWEYKTSINIQTVCLFGDSIALFIAKRNLHMKKSYRSFAPGTSTEESSIGKHFLIVYKYLNFDQLKHQREFWKSSNKNQNLPENIQRVCLVQKMRLKNLHNRYSSLT